MNRRTSHRCPFAYPRTMAVAFVMLLLAIVAGCGASPIPQFDSRPVMESSGMAEAPASPEMMDSEAPVDSTRKVIATAYTELVVDDTQSTVDAITTLVEGAGGYISSANLYRDSYGERTLLRGSLSLRVPAELMTDVMAQLEAMAVEVRSKNIEREDVTDQYSDIEAQLRNLEATENELRELLAEVRARPNASSEDILAVHRDLTQIRGEIEQLQGRQNMMDDRIALSTINVTLIPDEANRPVVTEAWQPLTVVRNATRALLSSMQFLASAAIWAVVYLLPVALIILIPFVVLVWIIRTIVVRRRRRKPMTETSEL